MFYHCCFSTILLWIIFVIGLFKIYLKVTLGIYKGNERLEGKTVIVTGASAGIGAECAKDLARRGARVIMLCRDMEKGEKVKNEIYMYSGNNNLVIKHIDFSSLASVRKCANEILSEEPRIDILLNNAGGAGLKTHTKSIDGLDKLMQTNHFGPFLFTNILLGKIKESAPSRIVNVSSVLHKYSNLDLNHLDQSNTNNPSTVYANSKIANVYFTTVLAEKLKGTGVTANSLHPGAVSSEIVRNANSLFRFIWDSTMFLLFKSSWEGAQTSIYLCVSPSVENVTGKYFADCKEASISKAAKDFSKALKLWELSEKAVQLKNSEKHY